MAEAAEVEAERARWEAVCAQQRPTAVAEMCARIVEVGAWVRARNRYTQNSTCNAMLVVQASRAPDMKLYPAAWAFCIPDMRG